MKKYFYFKLMTPGFRVQIYQGKEVKWNIPMYSKMRKVRTKDEEDARDEIYNNMLNNKWIGFRMYPEKTIKGEN